MTKCEKCDLPHSTENHDMVVKTLGDAVRKATDKLPAMHCTCGKGSRVPGYDHGPHCPWKVWR